MAESSGATYDYVIAGGGPAGCCLANRLSADPTTKVLLLEAGRPDRHPYIHMPAGFAKLTGARANWGYSTVPQKHLNDRALWYPQGKVLGGGSSINAMVYTRGNVKDYDDWADAGCAGWSYAGCAGWSYAEILPYFKRAEDNERFVDDYHGAGGPLSVSDQITPHPMTKVFLRAAQQAGLPHNPDFNGADQDGCGLYQVTQRDARRCSAAAAYIKPVRGRPNLTVKTVAQATRIRFEGARAVGVDYAEAAGGGRAGARAAREVLVTAGAIGSPILLLLSGVGPADELRTLGIEVVQDLPGVGRNLQDHMDVFVVNECTGDFSYDKHTQIHKTLWAGLQYLLFKTGPVTSNLAEGGAFWYADKDARSPDIQFHFMVGSGLEHGLEKLKNCGVTLNSALLRPRSRGTVRLSGSDPFAAPLIDPNYWAEPHDRKLSIEGFKLTREIMAAPAFRPYILAERLPGPEAKTDQEIAAYARRASKTDFHPVGACKMGVDEMAVVAPDLRVRGLDGLRVIDSSVMPLLVSSNTNAPTLMIAEKGADHVLGRI